uniref:hypothetical protein n=1 Tax=Burkholderia diffusa TaxID=488732 RepID=UPI001CC5D4B1|nr:hypothetical protein [Burkholderia diffusa]
MTIGQFRDRSQSMLAVDQFARIAESDALVRHHVFAARERGFERVNPRTADLTIASVA